MEKNESFNEVPLYQFLEFFIQSGCSTHVSDPELFIQATSHCCEIDISEEVSDSKETIQTTVDKFPTIRLKNSILKDLILNSRKDNSQVQNTWVSEFKKNTSDNELQLQNEIIQQLLDTFIMQIKGYRMHILKNFKTNRLDDNDIKIENRDNKLYVTSNDEIFSYSLFGETQILQNIADILTINPTLVASVLKHRDQKTFKYIIRNILALKYLKITGEKNQIVFEETSDELDPKVNVFLKRMLLDTHTI